jgi:3-hydroxyisobutyrate dehydrogenase-like beta-hydroxyacid dehydrogenase
VTVDAPVVGRQAEAAVGQLVVVVLRREAELLRRRLGGDGPASSSA